MNTKYQSADGNAKKTINNLELQVRNKEIDGQITELENTDFVGLVRENGLTPEMLAQIIKAMQKKALRWKNVLSRGGYYQ